MTHPLLFYLFCYYSIVPVLSARAALFFFRFESGFSYFVQVCADLLKSFLFFW